VRILIAAAALLSACSPDPPYEPEPTPLVEGSCDDASQIWDASREECVSEACGAGPYADPAPDSARLIHVDPNWTGGSNGGLSNPHRRLAPALAAAGPDDTVLLAAGEYVLDEPLEIVAEGTRLLGRCSELTRITTPGIGINVGQAPRASLQGLTFVGPGTYAADEPLINCFNAIGLSLIDVQLHDAASVAVSLFQCGDVLLQRSTLAGSQGYGILSSYSSHVTLDDVTVRDTHLGPEGEGGFAVHIGQGDTPTIVSSTFHDNAGGGLFLTESQDGTFVSLELLDNGGPGAMLLLSGNTWLRDSTVVGNTGVGVHFGYTTGGVLDSEIAETRLLEDGTGGQGLYVTNAQGVEIARNTVHDNREVGIGFTLSTGTITRNEVFNNTANAAGIGGRGIELSVVNDVVVEENIVTDHAESGIGLLDGAATIRNNHIERVGQAWWPSDTYPFGHGIHAQNVGSVSIVDNTVIEAHHAGIYVFTGSGPDIRGNTVQGTRSGPPPYKYGDGLAIVEVGGLLEVQGNTLEDNDRAGLMVDGSDVEVQGGALRGNWVSAINQNGASVQLDTVDVVGNESDTMLIHGPRIHTVHAQPMSPLIAVDFGDD
jgi:parallel beta-helix repeat protein